MFYVVLKISLDFNRGPIGTIHGFLLPKGILQRQKPEGLQYE
jgi:hypothetical protein